MPILGSSVSGLSLKWMIALLGQLVSNQPYSDNKVDPWSRHALAFGARTMASTVIRLIWR